MPAISRLGDNSAGHCYPPYPFITASSDVFANGIAVTRIGDAFPTHCCGDSCHSGTQAAGSPNVYVNGLEVARIGDAISCGDVVGEGSPDVFAN